MGHVEDGIAAANASRSALTGAVAGDVQIFGCEVRFQGLYVMNMY
ncbi:unnamed protein product, partial [marine sediment metagenome]